MTKLAPEWVRTSDPVIRSPARYRWTTAHNGNRLRQDNIKNCYAFYKTLTRSINMYEADMLIYWLPELLNMS